MTKVEFVDYRQFRLNKLNTPEFSHIKLLLFWPLFGLLFALAERGGLPVTYHPVYVPADDLIPFCEFFLPFYLFWFVFLAGMVAYTFFFDVPAFRKMMRFTILAYSATILIYLIYPTCQELRPTEFARDNAMTRFIRWFYVFDTNTNVCPSLHVIGSVSAVVGAWYSRRFSTPLWRAAFSAAAVLISVSTVFIKQHSVMDVLAALPLCAVSWALARRVDSSKKFRKTR